MLQPFEPCGFFNTKIKGNRQPPFTSWFSLWVSLQLPWAQEVARLQFRIDELEDRNRPVGRSGIDVWLFPFGAPKGTGVLFLVLLVPLGKLVWIGSLGI